MEHMVTILWDGDFEEMERDEKTYRFATVEELNAFMEGVAAARDTMSHEVLFDSRDHQDPAERLPL